MCNALASKLFLDLTAELLSRGTSVRFRPSGRSMYPSIREGELITVEPVGPSDIKRGDIILYRVDRGRPTQSSVLSPQSSSGVIAHRVVGIKRTKGAAMTQSSVPSPHHLFLLQGDASSCCDEPVAARQILGRVIRVERDGHSVALASRAAKMWHRARRLASGLKGWIYPGRTGSHPDLEFLRKPLTVVEGQLH
ncbi:hypothetical protein MYX75_13575 [Acidobacteria bacterium AH-259-A15]|nr:hypothetical protein [Acidobacteria bacterium AH-259-A15]